jgi:tRNA threonylcarbamoyladenosine biosynthesis protein TsaE
MIFSHLDEHATTAIASRLATQVMRTTPHKCIIYLLGDLGSGKTTFARSFIQHFGFSKVKSPTYSIVEPYENTTHNIYHFDLYRLCDFEELEMIGVREYFDNICLIEWADNFSKQLPCPDLMIKLTGDRTRNMSLTSNTLLGEQLLNSL